MITATAQGEMHDFTAIKYRDAIAKFITGLTLEQSLHKIALRIGDQFYDSCIASPPQPIDVQQALINEVLLDQLCSIHNMSLEEVNQQLQQTIQPIIEQMLPENQQPISTETTTPQRSKVVPLF